MVCMFIDSGESFKSRNFCIWSDRGHYLSMMSTMGPARVGQLFLIVDSRTTVLHYLSYSTGKVLRD